MKVTVIPIITDGFAAVPKGLVRGTEDLEIRVSKPSKLQHY